MQNKITELEEALTAEDERCLHEDGDNGNFSGDLFKRRRDIMDELVGRLDQYHRFVLQYSQIKARPSATQRQISYFRNWLANNNQPIRSAEVSFIEEEGDLMPVVPRVKSPLRRLIDRYDTLGRLACWRIKKTEVPLSVSSIRKLMPLQLDRRHYSFFENYDTDTTIYYDEKRIDTVMTCVTIGLGLSMLVGPLWLLQYVYIEQPDLKSRLQIITGFLFGFPILLSFVAVARPFEILAATAVYGAVLTVFMHLGSPSAGGGG
ncbi:MAG: hypothetical protein Q9219_004341 [cf. Caloplaca sp. 3 TL-2023]